MSQRIGLVGWFAYGNVGDDLLLALLAERLHPEVVFSTQAGAVDGIDVRDVAELERWSGALDLLLIGGGGLLGGRWIKRLGLERFDGDYGFLSVGIPHGDAIEGLGDVLEGARFVTVRDHLALERLTLAYPSVDAFWLPDPAFMLEPRAVERQQRLILNPRTLTPGRIRPGGPANPDDRQLAVMAAVASRCGQTHEVLALGFEERDRPLLDRLPCAGEIVGWRRAAELIAGAGGVLTTRLHGAILAAVHATPAILIDHDDKLSGLARLLDAPAYGWNELDVVPDAVAGMLAMQELRRSRTVDAYGGLVRRVLTFMTS